MNPIIAGLQAMKERWGAGFVQINFHSCRDIDVATAIERELGVKTRQKRLLGETNWLSGKPEGTSVEVVVFFDNLPPTCHLEKYIERVPKTEMVRTTDEFVEITRTKVVCDHEHLDSDNS